MTRYTAALAAAPVLAGCSLIYNPNNLPDPRTIDAALVDANACAVEVASVAPSVIEEGQGDGGSLPALVVLHGNNFVNSNLRIELKASDGRAIAAEPVTDAMASPDTTYLAFTVTLHVDPAIASAVPLDVVVSQDCNATATLAGQLTLQGLPELTAVPADVSQLRKKYSKVALGNAALTGTVPAEINAVSSIDMGNVTASASGMTAGPGGASGAVSPGGGPGGGGQGAGVSGLGLLGAGGGGGGAGYTSDGGPGDKGSGLGGGAGGGPGHQTGDDMLISSGANRASAGGGGGTGNLTGIVTGGFGGGGGGTVLVSAGGNVKIASIAANGAPGETRSSGGGGGGGGAGGTVLVSTTNGTLMVNAIEVGGGGAGGPNGGAGSPGRVRWDAPGGGAPSSPASAAKRGPVIAASASRTVNTPTHAFMVHGERDHAFTVRVVDQDNLSHDGGRGVFDDSGVAPITASLRKGYNKVCVTLDGGSGGTIAERCTDVAYLP